jgi:PAS domain S-box-containing protein
MFGASSELELIGKSVLDFSHPDSTPLIKNRIQQMAINNAILPIIEERFIKLDGSSTIDVEVQSLPIKYKGEDAYIVVAHDITERKKMETALHESEERYRSIVECSPDGIGVHRDGKILFVNTAGVKMYGAIAAEDMMGKFINDIIHKDSQQTSVERIGLINEGQDFLPIATLKLLRIDGTMLDVEVQSSSIVYDGGPAVQTTIRDITKRKQEEQQLRLLESVVTNTNDAILITEAHPVEMPGPRIVYVNEAFTKMTGYTLEEVVGKTPRLLQGPKSDRENLMRINKALKNWETCESTHINYKKNGEEFWVNLSISPVADKEGIYTHWIAIQRDVTVQKNEELQKILLADIGRLFNEAAALNTTIEKVLDLLVDYGGFTLAEAWLIGAVPDKIKLVATAPLNKISQLFYEECQFVNSYTKGEGLPGIAWDTQSVQVWLSKNDKGDFERSNAAKNAGIQSIFAIPIICNNAVVGVFIVGLDTTLANADKFNNLFENLGLNIGAEIKRKYLEQELYQLFNFAPDVICVAGFDGFIKKINPAASVLFEYTEEELLSQPYANFFHPDDREWTVKQIGILDDDSSKNYLENRVVTKSGKIIWLAWTSTISKTEHLIFSVARDITEKKELENLLQKSNSLAKLGSWENHFIENKQYCSDITKEIFEETPDFVPTVQKIMLFFKEGEYRDTIVACIKEGIASGKPWDEEVKIITAKGNERWVRAMGQTEFINGKCVRQFGNIQDIDARKIAELRLQQNIKALEDYKFALDQSSIIAITDAKGIIISANENFCNISKYNKDELIGKSHRVVNSGYHTKEFFKEMWQTIGAGKVWRGEIKNKTKEGTFYWVNSTIIPFLDVNKNPIQYLSIRFDITEKKLSEEAIQQSNERFNLVAKATNDAIWDWDLTTNIVLRTGEGFNILFGYENEEADSDNAFWFKKVHKGDLEKLLSKRNKIFNDPAALYWEDEYRFKKSDGHYATVYDKGYIIRDAAGKAIRVIGATQDISKLRENEYHLAEMNETLQIKAKELADSNLELEQFAYVASHDLQEPLRMITGFLGLIEKKYGNALDENGKKFIDFAVDGALRMRLLILDLLEYSRVGRMENEDENLDLNELVKEIELLLSSQILEKNASIQVGKLPTIHAKKAPLLQVFTNLIGNALKYSRKDTPVQINIAAKELSKHWQFEIADNGLGIKQEYFDKIFIIFKRLHNKDEFSGNGIGLAITKKVIEKQGGKIWLTSEPGKGSTFYFTIKK